MQDFVTLAAAARRTPSKDSLDRLWSSMFQLRHWFFIPVPGYAGMFSPFVGAVGNQRWVMTFTDPQQAAAYAVAARIAISGYEPMLSLSPRAAAVHLPLHRASGVLGVLVNAGPDAFYTPFENLQQMLHHFTMSAAPVAAPPIGHAATLPVSPPMALPTQRLPREQLLALMQTAADDPGRLPHAIAALRLEPAWFVVAKKSDPNRPQLEIGPDGRTAAHVFSDQRSAETMQSLMAMIPGDVAPLLPMPPDAVIARFAREDLVDVVVFNPRAEQLAVPLARLAV